MFPDDDDVLYKEYGKALSCHERAMLFAASPTILDEVRQRREPPDLRSTEANLHDLDRCDHITFLYGEAVELLASRLKAVADNYDTQCSAIEQLAQKLKTVPVIAADRDQNSTDLSRKIIFSRLKKLGADINSRTRALKKQFEADPKLELNEENKKCYKRDWLGLDNMCRLLMEEITYLRSRVDEFVKISISARSLARARKAIILSAIFAIAAICANIFKEPIVKGLFGGPGNVVGESVSAIAGDLKDLKNAALEWPTISGHLKAIADKNESPEKMLEAFRPVLDTLITKVIRS